MVDREKVIKGLECCAAMSGDECRKCPYGDECLDTGLSYGMSHLAADALALLQEQDAVDATIEPCKSCLEWNCNKCEWLQRIEGR